MHLALICPDLAGHLNPMTTLGRELVRRGHRVSLATFPRGQPAADRAGLELLPYGLPEYASGEQERNLAILANLTGFAGLRFTGRLLAASTAIALRDLPGLLKDHRVEGVVTDQICPAGGAVADTLGLPFAVACNALAMNQEPAVPPATLPWAYRPGALGRLRNRAGNLLLRLAARPLYRAINAYRRSHGRPAYSLHDRQGYGLAHVAQQPAFFDFPRDQLPPHFHYTGPWHEPGRDAAVAFPWERLDGRPVVYASLGTLQNRLRHVFAAILDGCAPLPVQVVLSLGRADAAWDGPVPGNAVVVPFAPQLDLLDRSAAVVTHAGLNTTLETLARGKPMLCVPVTNDQPGVASRVRHLGAGEVVLPKHATADRVRAAVGRLLTEPGYRTTAEGCARRMAGVNGLKQAADIVERALTTGTRVDRAA